MCATLVHNHAEVEAIAPFHAPVAPAAHIPAFFIESFSEIRRLDKHLHNHLFSLLPRSSETGHMRVLGKEYGKGISF